MTDLLLTWLITALLLAMIVWHVGFTVLIWRPFFRAIMQGKSVTEVYSVGDLLRNAGRAFIWPAWFFAKKTG